LKAAPILVFTGILGFLVGMVRVPALQVAVESSQVVAGIVQYPPGNAFYIYHTKAWTVLHQVGALLLLAGVSELALSRAISGLVGMAAFQALGVVVFALSRNTLLAIASAVVIVMTGVAEGNAVYPVSLMGTSHTYGALGMSLFVLVLGLFGSGCSPSAAFLLGLAPAVHAGLGIWLWVIVGIAALWERRTGFDPPAHALKPFAAGAAISTASYAIQIAFIADVPEVNRDEVARYLNAFVSSWDFHRAPLDLISRPMLFNIGAVAVAGAGLFGLERRLPRSATFLLRSVIICGVLGFAAVFLSWIPPQRLPAALLLLMPSRLVVINTMVLVAMVIGLSRLLPWKPLMRFAPAALLLVLVANRLDVVAEWARWEDTTLKDYTNDPLFAATAAERTGLLLTGGSLHLVQLQTRRPVLLDGGGLDALPYAPESGPEMQRVLSDVYGIDLLNPPPDALHSGAVPDEVNRDIWSKYSRGRWEEIARTHSVTQVLTPADWTLDLPIQAENEDFRLYRIR
jgi:hypothetical protein